MRNALRLYLRYVGISFRGQMQYRASFIMQSGGQFIINGIEFLGVWALFDRFGALPGWSLPEVAILYGMANVAWSLCDAVSRGFDVFGDLVRTGEFDRILLRPRSTVLQLMGRELTLRRVGRFSQGAAVLVWGACAADVVWTPGRLALLIGAVLGGACMFLGLIMIQAVMAIWTTEPLEIMNALTYGGVYAAHYPLSIYRPWFRRFFTFIVPLAFVNYVPALAILGRAEAAGGTLYLCYLSPLAGVAFLLVALRIWRFGVRHYRSTGS